MDYVKFGRTGLYVSQLCYGTMSFGGDTEAAEAAKIYKSCRDAGINFFDTANIYNQGASERMLGDLIAHERQNLIISSKGHGQMGSDINDKGSNRRNIIAAVEASLKRLGTDYLDIYFMHMWDPETPLEDTLRALEKLVQDGKVLHLGASNYAAWQVATALGISDHRGWAKFDVIQPMYNLVKRQAESELLPMAHANDLAVMPYSPVAGGVLTGKYLRDAVPEGSRLKALEMYAKRYGDVWISETALNFITFCDEEGLDPISTAIAWVMSHPDVTAPIVGAKSTEQLPPSLDAVKINMTPELRQRISDLSRAPAIATDRSEELK